eukprot:jgi/Bigna1/80361/fgenesh1_pg.70_\
MPLQHYGKAGFRPYQSLSVSLFTLIFRSFLTMQCWWLLLTCIVNAAAIAGGGAAAVGRPVFCHGLASSPRAELQLPWNTNLPTCAMGWQEKASGRSVATRKTGLLPSVVAAAAAFFNPASSSTYRLRGGKVGDQKRGKKTKSRRRKSSDAATQTNDIPSSNATNARNIDQFSTGNNADDRFDFKHMSPRARRLFRELKTRRKHENRVREATEKSPHMQQKIASLMKNAWELTIYGVQGGPGDGPTERQEASLFRGECASFVMGGVRGKVAMCRSDAMEMGAEDQPEEAAKTDKQIGSMIASVKNAPAETVESIPRPPRIRKTLRRMEVVRRKIAKSQRKRAKQGLRKGDGDVERRTGLELSKPPSASSTDGLPGRKFRKKTPRRRKHVERQKFLSKAGQTSRASSTQLMLNPYFLLTACKRKRTSEMHQALHEIMFATTSRCTQSSHVKARSS